MNALTGGTYGKYQRTRASINRPFKYAKHPPTPLGCLLPLISLMALPILMAAGLV